MRTLVIELLAILLAMGAIALGVVVVRLLLDGDYVAATIATMATFLALRGSTEMLRIVAFLARGTK